MKIEPLRGWRIILASLVSIALAALDKGESLPWGTDWTVTIGGILNVLVILLRFDTNTPAGKSETAPPEPDSVVH